MNYRYERNGAVFARKQDYMLVGSCVCKRNTLMVFKNCEVPFLLLSHFTIYPSPIYSQHNNLRRMAIYGALVLCKNTIQITTVNLP